MRVFQRSSDSTSADYAPSLFIVCSLLELEFVFQIILFPSGWFREIAPVVPS